MLPALQHTCLSLLSHMQLLLLLQVLLHFLLAYDPYSLLLSRGLLVMMTQHKVKIPESLS